MTEKWGQNRRERKGKETYEFLNKYKVYLDAAYRLMEKVGMLIFVIFAVFNAIFASIWK